LRNNLNDGVTRDDAIGMLSQHLITRPVFEALFGGDQFTLNNPVSQVMQSMIDTLDDANLQSETATLEGFYEHIRMLIGGITTAEARQKVITELYEKFFKRALPQSVEALGIVYTPIEIVDFINRSVNDLLVKHFDGTTLSDEGVHVLDPFTGTGTFITRLLQTGLINPADLARKYASELHANEIMLLAYYIAAINIETTYNTLTRVDGYSRSKGSCSPTRSNSPKTATPWTPSSSPPTTHEPTTKRASTSGSSSATRPTPSAKPPRTTTTRTSATPPSTSRSPTPTPSARPPPTRTPSTTPTSEPSAGHPTASKITRRRHHRIRQQRRLDRRQHRRRHPPHPPQRVPPHLHLQPPRQPTNQRRTITPRRRQSLRTRQPQHHRHHPPRQTTRPSPSRWGSDPLPRHRRLPQPRNKLAAIEAATVANLPWDPFEPNEDGDWINQRDVTYDQLCRCPVQRGLPDRSNGLQTNRDAWVYNSSHCATANVERMIDHYNGQVDAFRRHSQPKDAARTGKAAPEFVDRDPTKYSWDRATSPGWCEESDDQFSMRCSEPVCIGRSSSRGCVRWISQQRTYQLPKLYPTPLMLNRGISIVHKPGLQGTFASHATDASTWCTWSVLTNDVPGQVALRGTQR
jgi:hypothetical protein